MASWSGPESTARGNLAGSTQLWKLGWLIVFVVVKKSLAFWASDL